MSPKHRSWAEFGKKEAKKKPVWHCHQHYKQGICIITQSLTVRAVSGMEYICKNNDLHIGILLSLYEQGLAVVLWPWPELWFFTRFLTESEHLISAHSWNVRLRFYKGSHTGREWVISLPVAHSLSWSWLTSALCDCWAAGSCSVFCPLPAPLVAAKLWPSKTHPGNFWTLFDLARRKCCLLLVVGQLSFSFCFGYSL